MVNNLSIYKGDITEAGLILLKAYADLAPFFDSPPHLESIIGEYCAEIDRKVIALQASLYPDDVYDGGPGKPATSLLPDSMTQDISDFIGVPIEISIHETAVMMDTWRLVYIYDGTYYNPPLKGVW